jgi:iron complex transport system ATP-binding protein
MITAENFSYSVKDKTILRDISCQFEKGKMHLVLGPNGAGKSTLIKILSGELKPTQGEVLVEDKNIQAISLKELSKYRAVLSQNIDLSFPLSVHEVVLMGRYPHFDGRPHAIDLTICEEAMDLFDIIEIKNRNYLTLSGGEKQRVQFARVFTQIWQKVENRSRILLLDEPLTFLDVFYQYDLMKKIKKFMRNNVDVTVIGVVHDINIAAKFADHVILVNDATIYKHGESENVLTEKNIYDVFKVNVINRFEVL